ncbi:MAG: hypothetical protein KAJ18_09725 [Candidatus Omnitrophica bacterium]|nr:hypothetical protein [Candidatus Omnitrophota bacterium]
MALNHRSASPITQEVESDDEIDSECESEEEKKERFTISTKEPGIVAVTLREDVTRRVKWAPRVRVKKITAFPCRCYWQSEEDTEKAKKEKKIEQFWKIGCRWNYRWNINENQWRQYCENLKELTC